VKSALWGFELKSEKILGLENFSCVTAIFFWLDFLFGSIFLGSIFFGSIFFWLE